MTIRQLQDRLQAMKPHAFTQAEVIEWLSRVEGRVFAQIIQTHENPALITFAGYTTSTVDTTALIAPTPYDELYLYALMTQVDLHNMELDKYNNSAMLYNKAWGDFAAFWNREFMPVQRVTHFSM